MSTKIITFSKALRDRAKTEGRSLWAAGYDGKEGRWEANGMMEEGLARKVFMFGLLIYRGATPAAAFAEAGFERANGADDTRGEG